MIQPILLAVFDKNSVSINAASSQLCTCYDIVISIALILMAQQLYNTVMMLILSNIAMFWNLSSVCQEFCLILRRLYLNEHASVAASKYKIHSAENKKKES